LVRKYIYLLVRGQEMAETTLKNIAKNMKITANIEYYSTLIKRCSGNELVDVFTQTTSAKVLNGDLVCELITLLYSRHRNNTFLSTWNFKTLKLNVGYTKLNVGIDDNRGCRVEKMYLIRYKLQ